MSAEILSAPPPSGAFIEHQFDAYGDCLWVQFFPPDEEEWVGVFGKGDWGGQAIAVNWSLERAFVIARGVLYVLDTRDRRVLVRSDKIILLEDVVSVDKFSLFVAANNTDLFIFNLEGSLEWQSGRVAWDGIRGLDCSVEGVVSGESCDTQCWSKFTFEVESRQFMGAAYNGPGAEYADSAVGEPEGPFGSPPGKWWQFWKPST